MDWQLIDASDEDREFLFELHRLALGPYIEKTWGWNESWQRQDFDEMFPTARWKLLVVGGRRVGAVRSFERDQEVYLEDIEILPSFQRQGLGTSVILSLARDAAVAGRSLRLQVLKVNPAIDLYARLGFEEIGQDEAHIQMRRRVPAGRRAGMGEDR